MIPHERSLVERLKGKPFALVSIYVEPDREKLKAMLEAERVVWRIVWDGDLGGPIFTAWNVHSMPTIYVIDQEGLIRYQLLRAEELNGAVDTLVKEMEAAKP